MSNFECKVSDLMKKEKGSPKVEFLEDSNPTTEVLNESNSKSLFEILDNINNIKAIIITLLVYLIIHSELFINVLINSLDFLNSSGKINLIGNIILFTVTIYTFSYLS